MSDNNSIFDKMIEMGMGMSIANQIPQMINSVLPDQGNKTTTPPQMPNQLQVYASVNNMQAGPFNESELITLIQSGKIQGSTMVWKAGLANWTYANNLPEVAKLLLLYSK